jgi:hypothetical protein
MRLGRIEFRVRPQSRDWAVEFRQWPHQEFVQRHSVKRALVAIQVGPLEVGFWIGKPGQYVILPEVAAYGSGHTQARPRPRPSWGNFWGYL